VSGEADVLQIFLRQAYAEALLDAPLAYPPMFDLRDHGMQAMVLRVLVGSTRSGPDDAIMIEEALHALTLRAEEHAARRRTRAVSPMFRGGLAPAALRRVEEVIGTALDEAGCPTLSDLAAAAGFSVTHFLRAFRRQTGVTPHRQLLRRRMERAISLLRDADVAVADVADRMGFSTPAHFVASFRATTGVTPGAVRDALAGSKLVRLRPGSNRRRRSACLKDQRRTEAGNRCKTQRQESASGP
jgi:AraC family transcriptional regulator